MTISRKSVNSNMPQLRGQSPGWAAFDLRQREKQGTGLSSDLDSFPSITNSASPGPAKKFPAKHRAPTRTFSSVVRPSLEFPLLMKKHRDEQMASENKVNLVKLLTDTHSWADQSLIKDVLAAANNDVDQASILLKAMVSPDADIKKEATLYGTSSSTLNYPCESKNKCPGENGLVENMSDGTHKVLISGKLFYVPVEPEWEEDDLYLSQRKDAIKTMRVASKHSRAASNAFLRNDHVSAHHHSLRARGEKMAAEKLNAKAAEEILRVKNSNNGVWKLDLHGLHAAEAVSALKEHLHMIESQALVKHSASSDGLTKLGSGILRSPSLESLSCLDTETKIKDKIALPQQRQTVLHVITGIGNHSRESAILPLVVRNFLIENRYQFKDARPGVIAVDLKFRHM